MTTQEFSNEFDVLYNNIMSNQAPGLDEYEKSVFLTKAQNELVKNYFNPAGNKYQQGLDGSEKRQMDFSELIRTAKSDLEGTNPNWSNSSSFLWGKKGSYRLKDVSTLFKEKRILCVINEQIRITTGNDSFKFLQVIPLKYTDYTRLMSKPYKRPLKNQAWRLILDSKEWAIIGGSILADTNLNTGNLQYHIRYVMRPTPIILENLGSDLSIDGEHDKTQCALDPEIHHEILQRAVELAKAAYTGDVNTTVELGKRSE